MRSVTWRTPLSPGTSHARGGRRVRAPVWRRLVRAVVELAGRPPRSITMTDPSPPPLPPLASQAERLTSLGLAPGGDGPALAAAAGERARATPPGASPAPHDP